MSGGGIIGDILDPAGVTGIVPQSDFAKKGWSPGAKIAPKNMLDPAGLVLPLQEDNSAIGRFTRSYGLNDPLNLGGNGGLNTSGNTDYTRRQDAAAAEEATRNAPLPPLPSIPRGTQGGLGQGSYQPKPVVMPHLLPNPARSGGIRDRAFAQVLAPLMQQNWGLGQVDPSFLTGVNPVLGGQIGAQAMTPAAPNVPPPMYPFDPNQPRMWK